MYCSYLSNHLLTEESRDVLMVVTLCPGDVGITPTWFTLGRGKYLTYPLHRVPAVLLGLVLASLLLCVCGYSIQEFVFRIFTECISSSVLSPCKGCCNREYVIKGVCLSIVAGCGIPCAVVVLCHCHPCPLRFPEHRLLPHGAPSLLFLVFCRLSWILGVTSLCFLCGGWPLLIFLLSVIFPTSRLREISFSFWHGFLLRSSVFSVLDLISDLLLWCCLPVFYLVMQLTHPAHHRFVGEMVFSISCHCSVPSRS